MCKIHTFNKCASINRKINPNKCLQQSIDAQVLYLILIGQNNQFRQTSDQLAALRASGQNLVTKTYF